MTKVYIVKNRETGKIVGVFKRKQDAIELWRKKCDIYKSMIEYAFSIEKHKVKR